ncbi:MAG: VWA domain-containing protein [bacterium]|nr:MAG: VWA domain-containing protein [bacterium]
MSRFFAWCIISAQILFLYYGSLNAQSYYSVGDMIFCLDASGSMNFVLVPDTTKPWNHPDNLKDWVAPFPNDTRWAYAKEAFEEVMIKIDFIVENDEDENSNARYPENGWIGIIQFPDDPATATAFTKVFMPPEKIPDHVNHDNTIKENFFHNNIHDEISNFKPRVGIPGTPMGKGLEKAKEQFKVFAGQTAPIPNHEPNKRAIFLFTDGENNNPPVITEAWAEDFNKDNNGTPQDLAVYSIGFGNPADLASSTSELYWLSYKTGGTLYFFDPDGITGETGARTTILDLAKVIRDQVIHYLKFSNIVDPSFTLNPGVTKTFNICSSEYDTTLFLSVDIVPLQDIRNPDVKIQISDSLILDSSNISNFNNISYSILDGSQFFSFSYQFIKSHLGEWQVQITAIDSGFYDFSSFVRSGLGFDIHPRISEIKTGDVISFEMSFTSGAVTADSILAKLNSEQPAVGLGNLFAEKVLNDAQMRDVFSHIGNPNITPASYKYRYLISQGIITPPVFRNISVVFNDQGKYGDRVAGDGIYTWETEQIQIPDIYKFIFNITGQTSDGSAFCRSKTLHIPVFIDVIQDWNTSAIEVVSTGRDDSNQNELGEVQITLMDAFSNILGPGYNKNFEILITNGNLIGSLQNNLEGSYTQRISYPVGNRPIISVKYQDLILPKYEVSVPVETHWVISAHYGLSYPRGDLENLYKDRALLFTIDGEYYFKRSPWVLNLIVGQNRLTGKNPSIPDNDLINITLAGRYQINYPQAFRMFIEAGSGYYIFEALDNKFGATGGLGITYNVLPNISL